MPVRRNSHFAFRLLIFAALALSFLISVPMRAQVVGATLSGTISDPSGGVVPNAQVSVRNTATGVTRAVTADTAGLYVLPNLLPGTYEVSVTAPGFSTSKESNLVLGVGAQQQLNFSLKVGETTQTVQVTEAAPQVQTTSSTLSSEVEATTVRELPLNGRDWASLATLSPGVNAIENQMPFDAGAVRGNRGFGAQLTIAGGRPTQNNYRLDGLSINDYGNGGPGSVLGVSLGVDAIQEFSVLTGNYSAEYGRTSGGVVNAISKSGTNAFHGDAYEFLRNDALDAEDFFLSSAGQPKAPYKRNQFGVAAGGPIIKDRTFIFGDYEGIRSTKGVTTPINVPSDNARNGLLNFPKGSSTFPSGCVQVDPTDCQLTVNALSAKYLALYPHANGPVSGNKGLFAFAGIQQVEENFVTIRADHKISDKDSVFATYMFDRTPFTQPDPFNNVIYLDQTSRHIAALEWSHAFTPALINTARLGYNRNAVINYQPLSANNPAAADLSLGSFPGGDNPQIRIGGGFKAMSPGLIGGFSHHNWNSLQFYDDAFLTRGTHALKFGFAMENMRYNFFQSYNPDGIWTFTTLTNFLTNKPRSLEGGLHNPDTPRALRQTIFGGYVQDDWHWRHNLTLNLGLRYEMATVLKEMQGKLTNLASISDALPYCGTTDPALTTLVTPADQLAGRPGIPGCTGAAPYYSNPTTLNFEPRIGFAWDPRGDGKMAVRGGAAIFDILPLPGYFYTQQGIETPFFVTGIVSQASANLNGLLGVPGTDPTSAYNKIGSNDLTAAFMEKDPKRNYIEQWNLNVQRQITPSLTATLGYVGSHGVHMLIRGDDSNMVIPCPPACGAGSVQIPGRVVWPFNPNSVDMRINKNFGGTRFLMYGTNSSYEGLQANVQKRMSHGFQFGGSYTYSKSMDNDSATIAGDAFANSITSWFWFDPQISRAVSDFNVTHSAAINGIWDVPGSKSLHGFAGTLANGWELGSILKLNSGIPTTPLIAGDPLGVQNAGSDAFAIPDRVPGCDPVNHNFRSNPNGIFLGYINTSCFTMPTAPTSFAGSCSAGFPGATTPAPAGTVYCSNVLGNAGRNSVVGPGLFNLDFSVYKNFAVRKISESASVQFRAEFFNVFNHASFNPPNAFFGSGNAQIFNSDGSPNGGGGLESLANQPRDIQLALKLIW
jgi:Carboxypeptidase regulatory-like domain/TonB-dependent Receptor Plug Domain